jgi:hypothetical protein
VRLCHCVQCEMDDPLPPSAYRPILELAHVISPLAVLWARTLSCPSSRNCALCTRPDGNIRSSVPARMHQIVSIMPQAT